MALTPQSNICLNKLAAKLKSLDTFIICGHISPDGDCIGSQLALGHALRSLGKEVHFLLARKDRIDDSLKFLPGINELIPAGNFEGCAEAFISCDVPTVERIADGAAVKARCKTSFTIDHHASLKTMSDWNYVDPDSASTTMIVWELISALGIKPSADMAICTYTGLMTDTGGFCFQNTDVCAFRSASEMLETGIEPALVAREVFQSRSIASLRLESLALKRMKVSSDGSYVISYLRLRDFEECGGVKSDAEPIINTLRSIKGVRVACMLREQETGVRGSFRAKDDTNVAALAAKFEGGGHKAAAGFTIFSSVDNALKQCSEVLDKEFSDARNILSDEDKGFSSPSSRFS